MKVPLLDLKPQLESLHGEILEAVTRVVESTRYIMGPEIENLEKEIAEYCGTADAVGVSSGTDALLLSLMALDIGPGDLVLTTDFSFFATAGVISRLNATPVFLDINPENWNLDPVHLEQKFESMSSDDRKRVKAIIVVHLYGQSAEMKPLVDCAEKYGIPVIEDAAQAIGAECRLNGSPRKVGSMGTFGCFSFFPSKNLGGIGDGGSSDRNPGQGQSAIRKLGEFRGATDGRVLGVASNTNRVTVVAFRTLSWILKGHEGPSGLRVWGWRNRKAEGAASHDQIRLVDVQTGDIEVCISSQI